MLTWRRIRKIVWLLPDLMLDQIVKHETGEPCDYYCQQEIGGSSAQAAAEPMKCLQGCITRPGIRGATRSDAPVLPLCRHRSFGQTRWSIVASPHKGGDGSGRGKSFRLLVCR